MTSTNTPNTPNTRPPAVPNPAGGRTPNEGNPAMTETATTDTVIDAVIDALAEAFTSVQVDRIADAAVHAFDTILAGEDPDGVERASVVVHQTIQAIQIELDEPPAGDWHTTTEDNREFTRSSVREAQAGQTPRQSHETWMRDKIAAGWTYGPIRDNDRKIHPLLVSYDHLAPEQRAKDAALIAVVTALTPSA